MDWIKEASISAQKSDAVFFYVFALSVAFLVFITALMIFFVVRYSRARNTRPQDIHGAFWLEATWTMRFISSWVNVGSASPCEPQR